MTIEKEQAIEAALAKLTETEKELLGLNKKPKKPKVKKHYNLKVYYSLGSSSNTTTEEAKISINNPFVHIITNALDKLGEIDGHWGIMLDVEHYDGNKKIGNINDLEYDLLCLVEGYYDEDEANEFFEKYEFENTEENHTYLQEFDGIFTADSEYTFLVYDKYKLS